MKLKSIDKNLHKFLEYYVFIKDKCDPVINSSDLFFSGICDDFIKIIKESRKYGYNWIFSEDDIYEDSGFFKLPSVDLAKYFLDSGNNKEMETFFKENNIGEGISWDSEISVWNPKIDTRENAIKLISDLNILFDKYYLKT